MDLQELESLRKKAKNTVILGILCSIFLPLVLFFIVPQTLVFLVTFTISIIITCILSSKIKKKFNLAFKDKFVLESLMSVFNDLVYDFDRGIDESVIQNTNMMNMGNRYSSKNLISAKYKNVKFTQSDVHIQQEQYSRDSKGNVTTTLITIFKGRWMIFDFNKNFKSNIQVCQNGFYNSKISNWGSKIKFKKISMEDQDFNKEFKIYAQDEHEAFYILTPSLMEKIKNLVRDVGGKMLFCFIDNKLHIGVYNNRESFEHSIFRKIDKRTIEKISEDIRIITKFVDYLNLDNNLFKRKEDE